MVYWEGLPREERKSGGRVKGWKPFDAGIWGEVEPGVWCKSVVLLEEEEVVLLEGE
jgi:hypothetical protein